MISKEDQERMYTCAPLLGEPASTELRKVLDALSEAESRLNPLKPSERDTRSDSEQMREAADTIWQISEKYGLTTRNSLKRVYLALHNEADRIQREHG